MFANENFETEKIKAFTWVLRGTKRIIVIAEVK